LGHIGVGPKIIIGKSAQFCCAAVLLSCNSAQISNPAPLDSYSIVLANENGS
jgi:hypothetical protein